MARKPSEQVRDSLLAAAEEVFAESGYSGATVAAIARRAGVSTGNVYRYFEDKDALFYSVFTDEFAERFLQLLRRRVTSLVDADDLLHLPPRAHQEAGELLRFWVDNRLKVITILDRAQGSRHEGYVETFVGTLVEPTLAKFRADSGGQDINEHARFLVERIFRNTVRMIVAILETYQDEPDVRMAFDGFWKYQLAGLAELGKWMTRHEKRVDGT